MKFITEIELRYLYKIEPFTTYVLEQGAKITPEARQFLSDRRVTLTQEQCGVSKQANTKNGKSAKESKQAKLRENWCILRLRGKMGSIESLFILTVAELFRTGDATLSAEVMALGKCFRNVRNAERGQLVPDKIIFWEWPEEEIKNRADNLEKCFDMSEFDVRMENGKDLALLNHLRACLRELEPAILEAYWNEEQQDCTREDLIEKVNLIINILCMMMWKCLGGQKWNR